ncbi:MAG: hypothetical protein IJ491_08565 [Clostridia bacterium]|nr:hypothetical protein [Clostridia bacterium]
MLGKLIKHEIRHSARYHLAILIATVAVTAIVGLSLLSDSSILAALSCFALVVTGIATVIVTLVSVIKNFYDTIYGRQGYLTLTLPVKGSKILLSKVLVSFLWIVVGFIATAVPYFLIFLYARVKTSALTDMFGDALRGLLTMLPETDVLIMLLVVMVLLIIAQILTYVGYVYFSVTVANTRLFHNHPKLFGGLTFFAIMTLASQIGNFISEIVPFSFVATYNSAYFSFKPAQEIAAAFIIYPIGGTIFSMIVAVALLALTGYVIENKVNIK